MPLKSLNSLSAPNNSPLGSDLNHIFKFRLEVCLIKKQLATVSETVFLWRREVPSIVAINLKFKIEYIQYIRYTNSAVIIHRMKTQQAIVGPLNFSNYYSLTKATIKFIGLIWINLILQVTSNFIF